MKLLHLTLILFILFSPFASAKSNTLAAQDKQAVHKIIKNLTNKLFLLSTTQYKSKKLQNDLLTIMPDKIAVESEYSYIHKKRYIDRRIEITIENEDIIDMSIRKDVSPICYYLEDSTIDCDFKERIKRIEKSDLIPLKPHEYEAGAEYKFNMKMNESGDWYINKMKTWYMIPAPPISTLEVEKKYRQALKNKKSMLNTSDTEVENKSWDKPKKVISASKVSRQKKTEAELAEKRQRKRSKKDYLENTKRIDVY